MTTRCIAAAALILIDLAIGCGGDDEKPSSTAPTGMSAAQLCQTKCDMMGAPACPNMPTNWAIDCITMCNAKYSNFPNCEAQLKALDSCSITKVTYSCVGDAGLSLPTPTGACANEGAACLSCTQSAIDCF